ncbi:hypothetical protein HK101_001204 [Irineochytrium annulatum]|nr:hypothetical protein HK101_001204 [Irineochytrium annulatum]
MSDSDLMPPTGTNTIINTNSNSTIHTDDLEPISIDAKDEEKAQGPNEKQPRVVETMQPRGVVSYIFLSWLSKLLTLGAKRPLEIADLPDLRKADTADFLASTLDPYLAQVQTSLASGTTPKSPLSYVFKAQGYLYMGGLALSFINVALEVYIPLVLQVIIQTLESGGVVPDHSAAPPGIKTGWGLAIFMFAVTVVKATVQPTGRQLLRNWQFNIQSLLVGAIFEKSLVLSPKASKTFTEGRILQMVNTDTQQISMAFLTLDQALFLPFQIAFVFYFLSTLLGRPIFAAGIVIGASVLLLLGVVTVLSTFEGAILKTGDQRLKKIREVFQGVRVIKLRGAEGIYEEFLGKARDLQLKAIRGFLYCMSGFGIILSIAPIAMPTATFLIYAQSHAGNLDPSVIFPALLYFSNLFEPLSNLPASLMMVVQGLVAWRRVREFLASDERAPSVPSEDAADRENYGIVIENATVRWESHEVEEDLAAEKDKKERSSPKGSSADLKALEGVTVEDETKEEKKEEKKEKKEKKSKKGEKKEEVEVEPIFKDLNLKIQRGKLTAVVGTVGAGKSSLISAFVGDMTLLSGRISINGTTSLCQQQPWLLSRTLEENILFGLPRDAARLSAAVSACGLGPDLARLPAGLQTEIGEKGITLSGGQKARVALARAVYGDADVHLLDDPLAALDAHVGAEVFSACVRGALEGRTRVLITHQLHVLPDVDRVVVMERGRVVEEGAFQELMERGGVLAGMMKDYRLDEKGEKKDEGKKVEKKKELEVKGGDDDASATGVIAEEDRSRGAVKLALIKSFVRNGGGVPMAIFLILTVVVFSLTCVGLNVWLAWWTARTLGKVDDSGYLDGYAIMGALQALSLMGIIGLVLLSCYLAAKKYHEKAVARLLRAPQSWFDGQPMGRLLNRLSKDQNVLDQTLWNSFIGFVILSAQMFANVIVLIYSSPYVLILLAVLSFVYYFVLKMYRSNIREIRRILSIQRSPLFSHISESLNGVATIRTSPGAGGRFVQLQRTLMDARNAPQFLETSVSLWLIIRIDLFSSLIVLFFTLLGALAPGSSASFIGLALSNAIVIASQINGFVLTFAMAEADLVSVERLDTYANAIPQEAPEFRHSDPPEGSWPRNGEIVIEGLEVKYATSSAPVIKDLDLHVKAGEKIGVVGRTGSGKSTLVTTLFRLVEPEKGTIKIDGVDIQTLGLTTLRSRMQIIPQEPVLFTGTVRSNLDPTARFEDSTLWNALDLVGLGEHVRTLADASSADASGLSAPVAEGGENLSVGQRQLLILARAIAHKPKILVMDEASSAVDAATDAVIQAAVRSHFAESTVISIAHRLNTVAGLDRVVVLDKGERVEFDTPAALLRIEGGVFRELVDKTGAANAALIKELAEAHERDVLSL